MQQIKIYTTAEALGINSRTFFKREVESEQCYQNSLRCIGRFPYADIEYVEGIVATSGFVKVTHVWCYYQNRYFDVTYEKFFPGFLTKPRKILVQGTIEDLKKKGYFFTPYFFPLHEQACYNPISAIIE